MNISFDNATNFRKSLEARLKNIAIATGEDLQRLRRKVAFDRFLARLSLQEEPKFLLKGGYAMELRLSTARATKDIDLTCTSRAEEALNVILLEDLRALSKKNLGDFFVYQVEEAQIDLDGAPYGGARYPVSSLIDGKLFVRFQLDVGADTVVTRLETLKGQDWLSFCGIPSLTFPAISIEQQFAEKLHAYTYQDWKEKIVE
jgi:predicted nucleotidyltransferase component of viral defense system